MLPKPLQVAREHDFNDFTETNLEDLQETSFHKQCAKPQITCGVRFWQQILVEKRASVDGQQMGSAASTICSHSNIVSYLRNSNAMLQLFQFKVLKLRRTEATARFKAAVARQTRKGSSSLNKTDGKNGM